jgi:hypothetical protein
VLGDGGAIDVGTGVEVLTGVVLTTGVSCEVHPAKNAAPPTASSAIVRVTLVVVIPQPYT